ncbi:glycolate oxidase iron-sulfur subunit [Inhella inkyongensis]|uniref:Glycolate oxidase iron-sulfur subunit n=1 Tax=Inhella inkyongensis TaxID=392593 RepID=A0A840SBH5_9BURK|nr:glycolate oxidase subunit GlcF [Inhella inkyongensis]MBB5205700.1 glycolate oxidase iron-sulfur subunit [Inhella inkyongensis]
MHTTLHPDLPQPDQALRAKALIESCVHCGFCSATCPSFQVLGNELDSPRGRITLIRELLQGEPAQRSTQQHLDRCLSCRACETTCPSGVRYGELLTLGRARVDAAVARPWRERLLRAALVRGLPTRGFAWVLRLAQGLRPLLPGGLRRRIPPHQPARWPRPGSQPRQVLLLRGCVQPALAPNIEAATHKVLAVLGVQALPVAGCCGALPAHLGDESRAAKYQAELVRACSNRLPLLSTASACGLMIKEYGQQAPAGSADAELASRTLDLGEWLLSPAHLPRLRAALKPGALPLLAWQPPCTLQHGQPGGARPQHHVERGLLALGFRLHHAAEAHLCCGSAGSYSVLQPQVAQALRSRKLEQLQHPEVECIVSANVGCITHLAAASELPVRHWVEVLAEWV